MAARIDLIELVSGRPLARMADRLLAGNPRVVAFGVYIWNVVETEALIRELRRRNPKLIVVLGGPEVSHELDSQAISALADYVIQGPGDLAFGRLVTQLLEGPRPLNRVIAGDQPDLAELALPYGQFSDEDLRTRTLYVEASRGCPFKCEFCLSALDKTAWPFPLPAILTALADLHRRGARRFKFVDRTFNLKPATSIAILECFLRWIEATPDDPCFVHFELVPDHLPDALKAVIARFPAGTLQFEIGIQTFNPAVQQRISRRQDNARAEANLRWLRTASQAHLHVDLIAGLPGEDLDSFAAGFDRLLALGPHEIQLGILKRLRGAPIARHVDGYALDFDPAPPYAIRSSAAMPASVVTAIATTARFHDLVVNSGRMPRLASRVLQAMPEEPSPFRRLLALSTALATRFGRHHAIALEALVEATVDWLADHDSLPRKAIEALAIDDYVASGACGRLHFMTRGRAGGRPTAGASPHVNRDRAPVKRVADSAVAAALHATVEGSVSPVAAATPPRQRRHQHDQIVPTETASAGGEIVRQHPEGML